MQAEQEVSSLQPRINGLAFQRQDGENRLVDATQWLALDEALQRLMAEEELADCEGSLLAETAAAQASKVLWRIVLGPVDDAQILRTTALQGWLHQPFAAPGHKRARLHHHAFATARRQLAPPLGCGLHARSVGKIDKVMGGRDQQLVARRSELSDLSHMPEMVLVHVQGAFGRQQMERRDAIIIERSDRPTITPISLGILPGAGATGLEMREQRRERRVTGGRAFQERNRGGETGAGCGARRSILLTDQRLGLSGPRHDLRIEQSPCRLMPIPERHLRHG